MTCFNVCTSLDLDIDLKSVCQGKKQRQELSEKSNCVAIIANLILRPQATNLLMAGEHGSSLSTLTHSMRVNLAGGFEPANGSDNHESRQFWKVLSILLLFAAGKPVKYMSWALQHKTKND